MSTEKTAESSNLVSIICRTIGRDELAQALESVASQSYSPIETVVVNSAKIDLSCFNIDEKKYRKMFKKYPVLQKDLDIGDRVLSKDITFKKPNDLLVQKKKICGILQETANIN